MHRISKIIQIIVQIRQQVLIRNRQKSINYNQIIKILNSNFMKQMIRNRQIWIQKKYYPKQREVNKIKYFLLDQYKITLKGQYKFDQGKLILDHPEKKEVIVENTQKVNQQDNNESIVKQEANKTKTIKKGGRQKKVIQTSTQDIKKVQTKVTKPIVFKKGVINPLIEEIIEVSQQQEGQESKIHDNCCVTCTNKEISRLLNSQHYKQVINIGKLKNKISTLNQRYSSIKGICMDFSPLEDLLINKDKQGLQTYMELIQMQNKQQIHFAMNEQFQDLQSIDTGFNSEHAYGAFTRRVQMSRGGRQGNQAFLLDQNNDHSTNNGIIINNLDRLNMSVLTDFDIDLTMLEKVLVFNANNSIIQYELFTIDIISSGNIKLAKFVLKQAHKQNDKNVTDAFISCIEKSSADNISKYQSRNLMKKLYNGVNPLLIACINPSSEILKHVLLTTMQHNYKDSNGKRLVHYAAACQGSGPLQLLIEQNQSLHEQDNMKNTPFMVACMRGRLQNVKLILEDENRYNQKIKNKTGNMAMHLATIYGHLEVLKCLKDKGIKMNFKGEDGMTALHLACREGHYDIIQYLIENTGIRLYSKDKFKRLPLTLAVMNGNLKAASYLLQHGSPFEEPDSSGNTALHYACAYGYYEMLPLLIQAGASVNPLNSWKLTPLAVAYSKLHFRSARQMLDNQLVDVNVKNHNGHTVLMQLINKYLTSDIISQIQFLVKEKKADINIQDLQGNTALHSLFSVDVDRMVQSNINLQKNQINHYTFNNNSYEEQEKKKKKIQDKKEMMIKDYKKSLSEVFNFLFSNGADLSIVNEKDQSILDICLQSRAYSSGQKIVNEEAKTVCRTYKNGQNILHQLGDCLFYPEARDFVNTIINCLQQNGHSQQMVTMIDNEGYTCLLSLAKSYSTLAPNYYQVNKTTLIQKLKKAESELTYQQQNKIAKDAYEYHLIIENHFFLFIQTLVGLGADINQEVQKLIKFRDNIQIETESQEENVSILKQYDAHGLNNIIHFIITFASLSFIKKLFSLINLPLSQQNIRQQTILNIFLRHVKNEDNILNDQNLSYEKELKPTIILEYILNQKHKFEINDLQGNYLVHLCSQRNYFNLLSILVENGHNIDKLSIQGKTALSIQVVKRQLENCEKVLQLKANPNIKDHQGRTAMHLAINFSQSGSDASFELETLLINHGADLKIIDSRGRNCLFYAFVKLGKFQDKSCIDPIETVSSLLSHDMDISIVDSFGKNVLHYCAQRGATICGIYLMNYHHDLKQDNSYKNITDSQNNTPLTISSLNNHLNFVTMMIQKDSNVKHIAQNIEWEKVFIDNQGKPLQELNQKEEEQLIDRQNSQKLQHKSLSRKAFAGGFGNQAFTQNNQGLFGARNMNQQQQQNDQIEKAQADTLNNDIQEPIKEKMYRYQIKSQEQNTLFQIAIKQEWQGIMYLLLQKGFCIVKAIEEALANARFQLAYTLLHKVGNKNIDLENDQKQNLIHILAIHGNKCTDQILIQKIYKQFVQLKIQLFKKDFKNKCAFNYALQNKFIFMVNQLLDNEQIISTKILQNQDLDDENVLSIYAKTYSLQNDSLINRLVEKGMNINGSIKVEDEGKIVFMGILQFYLRQNSKAQIKEMKVVMNLLLDNFKCNINKKDSKGENALIQSVKNNSIEQCKYLMQRSDLSVEQNKEVIHYAVKPFEYGSFENEVILNLLSKKFDLNIKDKHGKTPIDYAQNQKTQLMFNKLKHLGSSNPNPAFAIVQEEILWEENQIDIENDAQSNINRQIQENQHKLNNEIPLDDQAKQIKNVSLFVTPDQKVYNILLTKTEINYNRWSMNVFYKMQILLEKVREVYIVYTRWGRIGSSGQNQQTPFANLDDAVTEFKKIFKEKTSNEYTLDINSHFEKKNKKYQLIKQDMQRQDPQQFLKPFNWKIEPNPSSVSSILKIFADTKIYTNSFNFLHLNADFINMSTITPQQLQEAKYILDTIQPLVKDLIKEQEKDYQSVNMLTLTQLSEKINQLSNDYYMLIPTQEFLKTGMEAINTSIELLNQYRMIDQLTHLSIASRILLAAQKTPSLIDPLSYIQKALDTRITNIPSSDPIYHLINKYRMTNSTLKDTLTLFSLDRKGELDRYNKFNDENNITSKKMLWHGSGLHNFLSILHQGLKVAPEGVQNGSMFGQGIYFADTYNKAINYSSSTQESPSSKTTTKFILLCEVALGKIKKLNKAQDINNLPNKNHQSVMGVGQQNPDPQQNLYDDNGAQYSLGQMVQIPEAQTQQQIGSFGLFGNNNFQQQNIQLNYNEYIVYHPNQVNIKYLLKIDQENE